MISLREHAGIIDNLVWNIFQLPMKILNTNHSQVIIDTNINLSALSISEAGYPFQVFVFLYALMLNVLIFLIHSAKLAKKPDINKVEVLVTRGDIMSPAERELHARERPGGLSRVRRELFLHVGWGERRAFLGIA